MTIEAADIRASRVFDEHSEHEEGVDEPFVSPLFGTRSLFMNI